MIAGLCITCLRDLDKWVDNFKVWSDALPVLFIGCDYREANEVHKRLEFIPEFIKIGTQNIPHKFFVHYEWKNHFGYARQKVLKKIQKIAMEPVFRSGMLELTHFLYFDTDDDLSPESLKNLKIFSCHIHFLRREYTHGKDVHKCAFSIKVVGKAGGERDTGCWQPRVGPLDVEWKEPIHENYVESMDKNQISLELCNDIQIIHRGYEDTAAMMKRQKEVYIPLMEKRWETQKDHTVLATMLLDGYLQTEEWDKADKVFEEAIANYNPESETQNQNSRWFRGSVIMRKAQIEVARALKAGDKEHFNRAIGIAMNAVANALTLEHVTALASMLHSGGVYEKAAKTAEYALTLPETPNPLVRLTESAGKQCKWLIEEWQKRQENPEEVKDKIRGLLE